MDEDDVGLSVGFAIDFQDSFGQLRSLDDIVGDVAANVFREFQRVEQATKGAINMGPATAQMTAFSNAATRELASVARENAKVERSGEGIVRQMTRQIEVFGKNASEIRQMRAEMRAVEAEGRGFTELAARIRATSAEIDRLEAAEQMHNVTARRGSGALQMLSFQLNDVATMGLSGASAFQIAATQGGQFVQVVQMAEGGLKGLAAEAAAVLIPFAPLIAVVAAAAGGFALFGRSVSAGIDTDKMIADLGLTKDEIKKLKNTSVSTGDVVKATFQVMAERVGFHLGDVKKFFGDAMDFLTEVGASAMAGLYAGVVGTFDAIAIVARRIKEGNFEGTLGEIDKQMAARFDEARGALKRFGDDVTKQIKSNKLADLKAQADKLKEDRTAKVDRHAEQLAREAAATEAQIKNLYSLADAYGVSGAAALIAEARVKAESKAIKQRGDIEEAVARQIRLAVAQRVSDAAKSTATLARQADIQRQVNAAVASGNILASDASQLMQDMIVDVPLLAALEAARATKDLKGIQAATDALERQRQARNDLADAEREQERLAAVSAADNRLEQLREEARLIGATDAARVHALATLKAEQEARSHFWGGDKAQEYVNGQVAVADAEFQLRLRTDQANDSLRYQADLLDAVANNAALAARGMADAFGDAGRALGDMNALFAAHLADRDRLMSAREHELELARQNTDEVVRAQREQQINTLYAVRSATAQIGLFGDMTAAAKGFFSEKSKGYQAMMAAEKVFRAFEFAMSVRSMIQDAAETISSVANSEARAVAAGTEGVANQSKLPFPLNIAAMAATAAALVAAGITALGGFGGSKNTLPEANTGTGTVLGDPSAQSASIKNAIEALKEVDTLTNTYAREMSASLKSIDSQIGSLATVLVRSGDINASQGVTEGFKPNAIGSILGAIPLIGGILGGLFGSKTSVIASGLYGGAQSLGHILDYGFDGSTYSDIKKKKKFLGITTSTKYSTQYGSLSGSIEDQFTLLLRSFNDAIAAAAGPLGQSTEAIEAKLRGFVINIGKVDLQGLTGEQIEDRLQAIFGAAADRMANAAFPGLARFQKVGEGAFETLVRVASTVEQVTNSLDRLGAATTGLSIEAKLGLADQFESVSDLTSAVNGYFDAFYTKEEQVAAQTAEMTRVFDSLGLTMPDSLAAFRALVEAQNLNTEAGRATYATLLQLAPAFANLQEAMNGAKSAADIASERENLQRQILQLNGDTEALRALDLAKLDASNRALQEQVWAIQDAQEAAKAADDLRKAWQSVGDSIMDEVTRIRGLTQAGTGTDFATLMGQFNAATAAARGGDIEAAKSLPQLSQALLTAAELAATSRQELDRVRAQTAASLEATNALIQAVQAGGSGATGAALSDIDVVTASQPATVPAPTNDNLVAEIKSLREEMAQMRSDSNSALAAVASNTGSIKRKLEDVTAASGGDAISTVQAA